MKVSKLRNLIKKLGFFVVKTLYPKFEADFREFYLKTIVSCKQNDRIFHNTT